MIYILLLLLLLGECKSADVLCLQDAGESVGPRLLLMILGDSLNDVLNTCFFPVFVVTVHGGAAYELQ